MVVVLQSQVLLTSLIDTLAWGVLILASYSFPLLPCSWSHSMACLVSLTARRLQSNACSLHFLFYCAVYFPLLPRVGENTSPGRATCYTVLLGGCGEAVTGSMRWGLLREKQDSANNRAFRIQGDV